MNFFVHFRVETGQISSDTEKLNLTKDGNLNLEKVCLAVIYCSIFITLAPGANVIKQTPQQFTAILG